jgi:L-fucose dehydrogenase
LEQGTPGDYIAIVESQSGPLPTAMAHPRAAAFETIQGFDREHSLEDGSHRPGKYLRIRFSKGAIMALTREWAVELLPYSIRVNTVIPAEVMTPLYRHWLDTFRNPQENPDRIVSKIPLENRMTTSEEIANVTVFLLSGKVEPTIQTATGSI